LVPPATVSGSKPIRSSAGSVSKAHIIAHAIDWRRFL
jgi:hypothetical protein